MATNKKLYERVQKKRESTQIEQHRDITHTSCEIYDLICFNYSSFVWDYFPYYSLLVSLFCKPPSL